LARALNYVVLLSIVAMIVAASGCSSNTTNNTSAHANTTPVISVTPTETPARTIETATPAGSVETATPASSPSVAETPLAITNATENQTTTNMGTAQRRLQRI
jgi:PBP1b-binding outer membrane lipoprotein LpoB